ncbi:hypothetical protein [Pseudooceanicola algae]|uniref:Uncharacterized protein n=1 Tax=Pseudooceanicola algae TaxID=1537215 RepID=A0A418SIZ4_9RHOB|nr:hypothetical protein [Pseudooceanicola algae]QPM89007.1 hypothetical protein PSAL_002160 [Pseudooceanicola algae]
MADHNDGSGMGDEPDAPTGAAPSGRGQAGQEADPLVLSPELRVAPGAADSLPPETEAWPGAPVDRRVLDNRHYGNDGPAAPVAGRDTSHLSAEEWDEVWEDARAFDEAELREFIRGIVREEMEIALRDVNLRNIRKHVKREIAKALSGASKKG